MIMSVQVLKFIGQVSKFSEHVSKTFSDTFQSSADKFQGLEASSKFSGNNLLQLSQG